MIILQFDGGPWNGKRIESDRAPGLITLSWLDELGNPETTTTQVMPTTANLIDEIEGYYVPSISPNEIHLIEITYRWIVQSKDVKLS